MVPLDHVIGLSTILFVIGAIGLLYLTGHDHEEIYAMRLPTQGATLELVEVVPIKLFGQGIAWDRSEEGIIYGIRKKERVIVKSRLEPRK